MSHNLRAIQPRKQLFLDVKGPWKSSDKYISIEEHEIFDAELEPEPGYKARTMFHLPRYLRGTSLLLLLLVLGTLGIYTQNFWTNMEETRETFGKTVMDESTAEYAAHLQPEFMDMVLVQTLDQSLLPTTGKHRERNSRLVIVGDVHGMKKELVRLLDKVHFDKKKDHLILTGDMISKGPDSRGVLDLIMDLGATSVRGNHEDRIILAHDGLHSRDENSGTDAEIDADTGENVDVLAGTNGVSRKGEHRDRQLAKHLSKKQIAWLKKCPVILRVGDIAGMGQVLVVHAGLVPGVHLHKQDPFSVMNMRTIDPKTHVPSDSRDGMEWIKLWNHYQSRLEPHQRSTVIYGHDSKRGLQIQEYSKGLDTGCLRGGQLTALVIEGGHSGAKQKLVHVDCVDGRT